MKLKRIRFELYQGGRAIASTPGWAVGNFCVYKLGHWHIAHLHTHTKLLADFACRKDALAVVAAMDSEIWNFDDLWPAGEQIDELHQTWVTALGLCEKKYGIWRLREKDVTDTTK